MSGIAADRGHGSFGIRLLLCGGLCAAAVTAAVGAAAAPSYKVLYRFSGGHDGGFPWTPLTIDSAGDLYGTSYEFGANQNGNVFRLSPPAGNAAAPWRLSVLYSFKGGLNGANPNGLLRDQATGVLYGTTLGGGQCAPNSTERCGTAFTLTPPPAGHDFWTLTQTYRFGKAAVGADEPQSPLVADAHGALYGSSEYGVGARGYTKGASGTIFKLTPPAERGGAWTETVLYGFLGDSDGQSPTQPLTIDSTGALYGVTDEGGSCVDGECGTVFMLTPTGGPSWRKTVIYDFQAGSDGAYPFSPLLPDGHGGFFGTASSGGACAASKFGCGIVYELSPPAGNQTQWTETVIYQFQGGKDASTPGGSLALDRSGNLYGVTGEGGSSGNNGFGWGTVFKLSPPQSGTIWTETVLHAFQYGADGAAPQGVSLDAAGTVYGDTGRGGHSQPNPRGGKGYGIVFKITQ